jgi:phosphotransferase system  glucose/maltose/N-acetylglucosamine-specific IIC component
MKFLIVLLIAIIYPALIFCLIGRRNEYDDYTEEEQDKEKEEFIAFINKSKK